MLRLEIRGQRDSTPGLSLCFSPQCGTSDKLCNISYLPSVGDGQKTGETLVKPSPFLSTMPTSHQPSEAADLSPETTTVPETSSEKNMTSAVTNGTGAHTTEEDAPIPTTPMAGTEAERLQASPTASPGDVTATHHEHHNVSLSVSSSTEIPSPSLAASTQEENPPGHEGTEPLSTTEEADAGSATPTPPLNSVPATNSSQLGPSDSQTMGPTTTRSGTTPGMSPRSATEESTVEPQTASTPFSTKGSTSSATTSSAVTVTPVVTTSTTTSTAAVTTSTSALEQPVESIHEKASVLDVGDDENPGKCSALVPALPKFEGYLKFLWCAEEAQKRQGSAIPAGFPLASFPWYLFLAELPSSPLAETTRADPLVIAVISVFVVMVGILGLVGFLRYRQHNSRMEFRRLQDLPMVSNAFGPAWHSLACYRLLAALQFPFCYTGHVWGSCSSENAD
ncbi:mucin-5AC-like isoform X2 [Apteryx rowi]|uniref:mucin-5AC-like isoform X2 n=1 Tax=Apteryx rowi TaxID=308060 RepID=UPI000E1E156F|nr:mucin-5AC-like isoform X2 [Apteryx rowi]